MATTEATIERRIRRWIDALPEAMTVKLHGGGRGHDGEPDIFAVVCGQAVMLEVKRPGESSRPNQVHRQRLWAEAGALVAEVHSLDEAKVVIEAAIKLAPTNLDLLHRRHVVEDLADEYLGDDHGMVVVQT